MRTAIVLSGGGAKGAYQIGVWKALRELHIKYDIVTGTSVGALNGALMVQNTYYTAYRIWKNISYTDVYGKDFKTTNKNNELNIYKQYAQSFIDDGGMNITSLENLFGKYINKSLFKLSRINYGIITVNVDTLKPTILTKKELLEGDLLRDYVIASAACFPAIKPKVIDDKKYIDGGYYDNLPINLAIDMGAKRIIAVDLKAPGIKKNINNSNIDIIKIYPKNDIGSFLVFDSNKAQRAIKFGYNDTMKAFNKLDGNKYTFKKGELYRNYDHYKNDISLFVSKLSDKNSFLFNTMSNFNELKPIIDRDNYNMIHNNIIEYLASAFDFDETNIYEMKKFNKTLISNFDELTKNDIEEKSLVNSKDIIHYIYKVLNNKKKNIKKICKIITMFKKEFMATIYICILKQK